jgi:hypothetical protein
MARRQALLMLSALVLSACGSTVRQSSSHVTRYDDGARIGSPSAGVLPSAPTSSDGSAASAGDLGGPAGASAGPIGSYVKPGARSVGGASSKPTSAARQSTNATGSPAPTKAPAAASAGGAPVSVGFVVADNSTDTAFKSAGLGAVQVGDQRAQVDAVVNDINSRGGLAGRKVNPVFHSPSSSETPDQAEQATCDAFTVDARA